MQCLSRRALLGVAAAATLEAARKRGTILVHEHVMVDFIGAAEIRPDRYDADQVFRTARPKLEEVYRLGCRRMMECTPNFLGRDPKLLARLEDAVGIELWTNTGLYGAAQHKFVPEYARREPAQELARRWVDEVRHGVDGRKPRFIKIGVNSGPLDAIDRKLVEAAALTSLETGLTIASHTGNGAAALEQLEMLESRRVPPRRFVWVHAQNEKNQAMHEKVARAGAWVEFDGICADTLDWHVQCVRRMASQHLLNRTLISQDAGWYHVGEPGGGEYRGYTYIYSDFVPLLHSAWIVPLLVDNPLAAFGK